MLSEFFQIFSCLHIFPLVSLFHTLERSHHIPRLPCSVWPVGRKYLLHFLWQITFTKSNPCKEGLLKAINCSRDPKAGAYIYHQHLWHKDFVLKIIQYVVVSTGENAVGKRVYQQWCYQWDDGGTKRASLMGLQQQTTARHQPLSDCPKKIQRRKLREAIDNQIGCFFTHSVKGGGGGWTQM